MKHFVTLHAQPVLFADAGHVTKHVIQHDHIAIQIDYPHAVGGGIEYLNILPGHRCRYYLQATGGGGGAGSPADLPPYSLFFCMASFFHFFYLSYRKPNFFCLTGFNLKCQESRILHLIYRSFLANVRVVQRKKPDTQRRTKAIPGHKPPQQGRAPSTFDVLIKVYLT